MPPFEPFRGLRYNGATVRLDKVVAPPYDVIGPAERATLAARHTANAVLVELPEPDLRTGVDRYRVAAGLLAHWQREAILVTDPTAALYPYRMTAPDGRSSAGVIGALGLSRPGAPSDILPHEETLPKPKSDRLDLLRATRTNLSPIWGLSLTPGLTASLDFTGPPASDVVDDDGVRHELWVLDDPAAVARVSAAVAASPVVIADGHHRYETALAYQREQHAERSAASAASTDAGAPGDPDTTDTAAPGDDDFVMALVVELSEDQLMVGAIHRTVTGLPADVDLVAALGPWFDAVRAGPADERTVTALGEAQSLALLTPDDAYLLIPHDDATERAGSDLDSSVVAHALAGLPPHESAHCHTYQEAAAAVASGEAQAALLLRPVTVAQIAAWAGERRRMPPKTTYFWPKPRTGMVFRSLGE